MRFAKLYLVAALGVLAACPVEKSGGGADLTGPTDLTSPGDLTPGDLPETAGDLGPDLTSPGDLAAPDLLALDLVVECVDVDGDGRSPVPGCTVEADCNDANPNVWTSCATCKDEDGDGFFVGCDAYVSVPIDCDDGAGAVTALPEVLADGIDQDCDGSDLTPASPGLIFVSSLTGNDSNAGSSDAPYATIGKALQAVIASKQSGRAQRRHILVAVGTYAGDFEIHDGASLHGGLDASTWEASGYSTLQALGPNGLSYVTSAAQRILVNRFFVDGAAGTTSRGLSVQGAGSLSLRESDVRGGDGTMFSIGVSQVGGVLELRYASIRAGSAQYSEGIEAANGTLTLFMTTVDGATGGTPDRSWAVSLGNSNVVINQSVLRAGLGTDSRAITVGLLDTTSNVEVRRTALQADCTGLTGASCIDLAAAGKTLWIERSRFSSLGGSDARAISGSALTSFVVLESAFDVSGASDTNSGIVTAGPMLLLDDTVRVSSDGKGYGLRAADGVVVVNTLLRVTGSGGTLVAADVQPVGATATVTFDHDAVIGATCAIKIAATCLADVNDCSDAACDTFAGNLTSDCVTDADWKLADGAPCISAGIDPMPYFSGSALLTDVWGTPRPIGAWDIGAVERGP